MRDQSRSTKWASYVTVSVRLWLIGWVLLSLLALTAMGRLWWTRERVLYVGKTAQEQRATVISRAGLPAYTLPAEKEIAARWPSDTKYELCGSPVAASYLIYLLIPRVPGESGTHRLTTDETSYAIEGPQTEPALSAQTASGGPRGLILSMLAMAGMAGLLRRLRLFDALRGPELLALAVLTTSVLIVVGKALTGHLWPGALLAALLGGTGGAAVMVGRRGTGRTIRPSRNPPSVSLLTAVSITILAAATMWAALMAGCVIPDDWDAWATWAPKAKALVLCSNQLADVTAFGHADYPLLWPSTWAFSSWCAGAWEEQWSKIWCALFMLCAAYEVAVIAWDHGRGRTWGWVAAAAFVSAPAVPLVASWAYAEAPFWLMTICSLALGLRWEKDHMRLHLILAGIFAAGAAWTKNEGVLYATLATGWIVLVDWRRGLRNAAWFIAPVFVLCGPWWLWIHLGLGHAPATTANLTWDMETLTWAARRLPAAIRAVWHTWSDLRQWNLVLAAALGYSAWIVVRGPNPARLRLIIPFGMLTASFIVDLFYRADVGWTFGTTWNRLTCQSLVLLIGACAARRTPQTRDASTASSQQPT